MIYRLHFIYETNRPLNGHSIYAKPSPTNTFRISRFILKNKHPSTHFPESWSMMTSVNESTQVEAHRNGVGVFMTSSARLQNPHRLVGCWGGMTFRELDSQAICTSLELPVQVLLRPVPSSFVAVKKLTPSVPRTTSIIYPRFICKLRCLPFLIQQTSD